MERREFMKSAGLLGAGMCLSAPATQAQSQSTNWAGNVTFRPRTVATPNSFENLQRIVREATRVKIAGSRHSFNAIASPDDTWVNMSRLPSEIHLNSADRTAELPGWMTLQEAGCKLNEKGFAFASLGEIDEQTVAGATATSTHGSGLEWGTLSDNVRAVKLVTASGDLVELRDGDALASVRTHLGALGAVISMTMDVVPAHRLERHQRFLPLDEACDPSFMRSAAHAQIYYLPFANRAYVKTMNPTEKPSSGLTAKKLNEYFKENMILNAALSAAALKPSVVPSLLKKMAGQFGDVTDIGPSGTMMVSRRVMRYHEMELALDLKDVKAALDEVRNAIHELSERPRDPFFANLPVSIRAVRGYENNFLSPTLGRDTAYISLVSHTAFRGYQEYFKSVEERLTSRFGARPHWAKHFSADPLQKYPHASRFLSQRRALDPQGKFVNPFLKRIFSSFEDG
ncbi:MAG: D-arabinono-1,4-lactone oxidase [Bdellovibrionia bacterium]